MPPLKILNSKEIKYLLKQIEKQWGAELDMDCGFLAKDEKIFIVSRDISKIDLSKLRINTVGMYFCEDYNGIRPSIEGSQIIGRKAVRNVVEVDENQKRQWLRGEDIEAKGDYEGFVILRNGSDFLGAGKYKEGKVLNYVPKERRIAAI